MASCTSRVRIRMPFGTIVMMVVAAAAAVTADAACAGDRRGCSAPPTRTGVGGASAV